MHSKLRWIVLMAVLCALTSVGHAATINFAGLTWTIKNGGPKGPGPNYWSSSGSSVWVDEQGRLHLKIRKVGSTWYCSEVYLNSPAVYGNYRFKVDSNVDTYDPNIILGLFTYANDNEEIDIELSRWGNTSDPDAGQYVVQPYYNLGNVNRFSVTSAGTQSTHEFNWQPDSIFFQSYTGHDDGADTDDLIHQFLYTGGDIPPLSSIAKVHINLWLRSGLAPINGQEAEVIISDFQFTIPINGDLNGDGFVGLDDLDLVLNDWNHSSSTLIDLRADPTHDGFVGLDDLDLVLNHWNAGTPPAADNVIPEPAGVGLMMFGILMINTRRNRP